MSVRDHVKVDAVHLSLFVVPLTEMSPNEALRRDKSCSLTSFPLFGVIGPLLFCKDFELAISHENHEFHKGAKFFLNWNPNECQLQRPFHFHVSTSGYKWDDKTDLASDHSDNFVYFSNKSTKCIFRKTHVHVSIRKNQLTKNYNNTAQ